MTTTPYSERAKTFVEQCAATYRDAFRHYGHVAARVADKIDNGDFGPEEWVRTVTQLCDIAAYSAVELAETVLAGPGAVPAHDTVSSDVVTLPEEVDCPHVLSVSEHFKLPNTSICVPSRQVGFVPGGEDDAKPSPLGLLPAGVRTFRVIFDTRNLTGGTYVGWVRARPQTRGPNAPQDQFVRVQVAW